MIGTLLVLVSLGAPPKLETPEAVLVHANALRLANDLQDAEKLLRDGAKRFPDAPGFHLALGEVHWQAKRRLDAFYEWQWELLREGPDSPTGHSAAVSIAAMLKARGPDIDDARVVLEAVRTTPKDPEAALRKLREAERLSGPRFVLRVFTAEALEAAGDDAEAAEAWRAVIAADRGFVPAYVGLADVLRRRGEAAKADELLATARRIDDGHWSLRPNDRP